jgi:hypothetical protein
MIARASAPLPDASESFPNGKPRLGLGSGGGFLMNDKLHPENQNTTEFSFLGNPRKVITREREGQYSDAGDLGLGDYATTWEKTFDEQGRSLEWKFFENSAMDSVLEYRSDGVIWNGPNILYL